MTDTERIRFARALLMKLESVGKQATTIEEAKRHFRISKLMRK